MNAGAAYDELVAAFPAEEREALESDRARFVEAVGWLGGAKSVLDVGGGHGYFAPVCSRLGIRAIVTDSFDHPYFDTERGRAIARVIADLGVGLVTHSADGPEPLPFETGTFDAATSFDSLEHWHHSPRSLFQELARVVRPGGTLVLAAPNAVNLRKRGAVMLGRSNWSHFEDWYFEPVFYGHVREPVVSDLRRIAADLDLWDVRVLGRNWLGYRRGPAGRLATRLLDHPLRMRPSMCSTIYLIGRFPDRASS